MSAALAVALPPEPFRAALLRRGIVMWLGVRMLAAIVVMLNGAPPLAVAYIAFGPQMPLAALVLIAVSGFLVWLDLRAAREHILLANLGVSRAAILVTAMTPSALLEFTTHLAAML